MKLSVNQLRLFFCILTSILLMVGSTVLTAAQTPPPGGMIGWWAGDGDARDGSGNGFHGALFNNSKYAVCKVGQGFDFTAGGGTGTSAKHLEVPDHPALRPAEFTIEAWVKFTPIFNNYHVAIAKGFAAGFNDSYALGTDQSANPQFFTTHNGSSHLLAAPANLANPTNWNHLAATYDGLTKRLFVNGNVVASVFVGLPVHYDVNPAPLTIGSDWEASQPFYAFNGFVDEAALYNRALGADEVQMIFNAGVNGRIKSAPTNAGANSQSQVNDATITFQSVVTTGTTRDNNIDPTTLPALPAAYTHTGLAYEISTTAVYSGNVQLCFNLPALAGPNFNRLHVLHLENGSYVDSTNGINVMTNRVCGRVATLSPFVIARGQVVTSASVSVGGRVIDSAGRGIYGARVTLTNTRNGEISIATTNPFGYYRFIDVLAGETYLIEATSKRHQFAPQVIAVTSAINNLNFIAQP